jgi:hypothetical protein
MAIIVNYNIFGINKFTLTHKNSINALSALIIAPIFETLVISLLIKLLSEKIKSDVKVSLIIGFISSVIHGLQNFTSFLVPDGHFIYIHYFSLK